MDGLQLRMSKIPGTLMPIADKEKHLKDLTKLTMIELLDLRNRESKLLNNKEMIRRLKDKGKRIQEVFDKIVAEIERRSDIEVAANAFSKLNVAEEGIKSLNNLEWEGKLRANEVNPIDDVIDSDDEEIDPLKIIASRQMHEKRIIKVQPEPTLITEKDLEEIKSFNDDTDSGLSVGDSCVSQTDNLNEEDSFQSSEMPVVDSEIITVDVSKTLPKIKPKLKEILSKPIGPAKKLDICLEIDEHVKYLVKKTEAEKKIVKEKFLPFRTTKSNVHDPEKEKQRKLGKYWELSSAAPPLIKNNAVQMISLIDSVKIQAEYLAKIKQIHEEQAAKRLAMRIERLENRKLELPPEEILKLKSSFKNYRNPVNHIEGELKINEDDNVYDEEPKMGGVNYTTYE